LGGPVRRLRGSIGKTASELERRKSVVGPTDGATGDVLDDRCATPAHDLWYR